MLLNATADTTHDSENSDRTCRRRGRQDQPCQRQRRPRLLSAKALLLLPLLFISAVSGSPGPGAAPRMVEVADGSSVWAGRIMAMDQATCCLMDRYGVMQRLPVSELRSFRVVAEKFRPATAAEMREQLRQEFPDGYEIAGSTYYLVCAPRGKANAYRDLFDEIYRSVEKFYRVRGLPITAPDTVLTAVVFGSQQEFAEFCRRDEVAWSPGLRGYYSLRSNRIIMFDTSGPLLSPEKQDLPSRRGGAAPVRDKARDPDDHFRFPFPDSSGFSVAGQTSATIIHETTHQVGYNIGVHRRTGGTPAWLLEGLATVLESPGVRSSSAGSNLQQRLNRERCDWFRSEYASRRRTGDVAALVASEDMFRRNTLDAYSLSWAVSFFITESPVRSRQLVRYMQRVESRPPGKEPTAEQRLADFQDVFGDIVAFEVEFLRFVDRLEY